MARQLAVRRFSAWCAAQGEIDYDDLLGLEPPKLDQKVVERLSEEQIRALVKACSGTDLRDRRDEAIVRCSPWSPGSSTPLNQRRPGRTSLIRITVIGATGMVGSRVTTDAVLRSDLIIEVARRLGDGSPFRAAG